MQVGLFVVAVLWALAGRFVRRWPETLAGCNTMSPERRKLVDIRAAGRCVSRSLFCGAALLLVGALLPSSACLWAGAAALIVLAAGGLYGQRYDAARSIRRVRRDKRRYLSLLLEGDESEELIAGYLERSDLWVFRRRGEAIAVCAVTDEGGGTFEIRNLAVAPAFRRQGFGSAMIAFASWRYGRKGRRLVLGTGEVPSTLAFYRSCGFVPCGREEGYFSRAYDHPIVEEGVVLNDRVLLRKNLKKI